MILLIIIRKIIIRFVKQLISMVWIPNSQTEFFLKKCAKNKYPLLFHTYVGFSRAVYDVWQENFVSRVILREVPSHLSLAKKQRG